MSIRTVITSFLRNKKGNALIEFALATPILLLLCVGGADFGRVFYHVITLTAAADAGASYGALRTAQSGAFDEMEAIAVQAASDVAASEQVTAHAERFCDCPSSPASSPNDPNAVSCSSGSCPGYGDPRVYVSVQVRQTFSTLVDYPGILRPINLGPTVVRRVR